MVGLGLAVAILGGIATAGDMARASPTFAASVALAPLTHLRLEAEIGYVAASAFGAPFSRERAGIVPITGVAVVPVTTGGRVTPYALGGGALVWFTGRGALRDRSPGRALVLGGGAMVSMSRHVGMRGDVRHVHVDNAPNFWRVAAGITLHP